MQLISSSARRNLASPSHWVCHSCRAIQRASTSASSRSPALSAASLELRNAGPARTRFAPSPTGYLHLGSLRTALFNYLVAKATGGQFVLRIEDTDQKRTVPGAEERLYQDLDWAGIQWDEGPEVGGGYGPYKQSERTAIYREHTEQLLHSESAYRCFCTPERLHQLATHRQRLGQPPDYDRKCAHIPREESDDRASKGEAHVVRLKVPDKYPVYRDVVYGLVRQRGDFTLQKAPTQAANLGSYDDPVLLKSDGFPTYHLANVVDDHLMKITHVIRGSEWMSSTPKHLAMYEAFGWQPPKFAHVSLLVDTNGAKLSKRTGSIDLAEWREKGVFPEALINYVALLGWSHNEKHDIMGMEELIRHASLKFTKGDTIVAFEKLWFLQKRHAQRYASLDVTKPVNPRHDLNKIALPHLMKHLRELDMHKDLPFYHSLPPETQEDYVRSILWADAQNYTTPEDFINRNTPFFIPPNKLVLTSTIPTFKLHNVPKDTFPVDPLAFIRHFSQVEMPDSENWNKAAIKIWTNQIIEHNVQRSVASSGLEKAEALFSKAWGKLVHGYIRWAIAGGIPGPDGSTSMSILGAEEAIRRFEVAREVVMLEHGNGDVEQRNRDDLTVPLAMTMAMSESAIAPSGRQVENAPGSATGEGAAVPGLVGDEAAPSPEEAGFIPAESPSEDDADFGFGWLDDDDDSGGDNGFDGGGDF